MNWIHISINSNDVPSGAFSVEWSIVNGSNTDQKKLLILGANAETIPLIQAAQELGVQVGVTDFNPSAPAKKYADKAYNVDGLDVNSLVALVEAEKIDGVMVGVADRLIDSYRKVCERLRLPCYVSEKQCRILTNKLEFNAYCQKFDIKPIPSYEISARVCEDELADVVFPLLVKPVDANSGKGMTVCRNSQELRLAIEYAVSVSGTRRYLVERYMECDDILMYFTFKDGKCWISAVGDRFTYREQASGAPVCEGAIYPSQYVDLYLSSLHDKFCHMYSSLGIENGVLLVCGFVEGENIFVYDPGFRLQGEAPNLHLKAINGFDQCQMLTRFALTGAMGSVDVRSLNDVSFRRKHAATVWILLRKGVIQEIKGFEEVKKDQAVTNVVQRLFPGDSVTEEMEGTEAQVFARVYLACDSHAELLQTIHRLDNVVSIVDRAGQSMLLRSSQRWYDAATHA